MFGTWKRECLRYFQILSVSFQGCICCISFIWDEIYYPFMVGDDLIRNHSVCIRIPSWNRSGFYGMSCQGFVSRCLVGAAVGASWQMFHICLFNNITRIQTDMSLLSWLLFQKRYSKAIRLFCQIQCACLVMQGSWNKESWINHASDKTLVVYRGTVWSIFFCLVCQY